MLFRSQAFAKVDNQKRTGIPFNSKIWNYGTIFCYKNKKYTVSARDMEIFFSLKSLGSEISKDGKLVINLSVPFLQYLRSHDNTIETERLKKINIAKEPLKPSIKIDFKSDKGLNLEMGYVSTEKNKFISLKNLEKTVDGRYIKNDNVYIPLPDYIDADVKRWMDVKNTTIALGMIPEFFKRDLVLLKTKLTAVLTDSSAKIKIIEKPFIPKINIDIYERRWLDFKIDYIVGKYQLPKDLFLNTQSSYVHPNENTWIYVDNKKIKEVEKHLSD